MTKKHRLFVCVFVSLLPLFVPSSEFNPLLTQSVGYYADFDFHRIKKTPLLYRRFLENRMEGVWTKKAQREGNEIRLRSIYQPNRFPPHVKVYFDNRDHPVRLERYRGGVEIADLVLEEIIHLSFKNKKLTRIRWETPSGDISARGERHLEYKSNGELKIIRHLTQKKKLYQSDHYFYDGKEISIFSVFPKGKVKQILIARYPSDEDFRFRTKTYAEKNVIFDDEKGSSPPSYHFIDDFQTLRLLRYDTFSQWEIEAHYLGHGRSKEKRFFKSTANPPSIEWYKDNKLIKTVYLDEVLENRAVDDSYTLFKEDKKLWQGYRIVESEGGHRHLIKTTTFLEGLLKEEKISFHSEDTFFEQIIRYRYFPNREIFNRSTYFNGNLIKEEQFNVTEKKANLKPATPLSGT